MGPPGESLTAVPVTVPNVVSGTPCSWTWAVTAPGRVAALAEVARVAPRPPSRQRDRTGTPIRVSRDLVFIYETTSFFRKGPGLSRPAPARPSSEVIAAVTGSYVNSESKSFNAAIRPDSAAV